MNIELTVVLYGFILILLLFPISGIMLTKIRKRYRILIITAYTLGVISFFYLTGILL